MGGYCEGVRRMFTPSDSDRSGNVAPAAPSVAAPAAEQPSDIGTTQGFDSAENQAARRRLARMSKYFTSPTGTLDTPTGAAGVF